MPKNSNDNFGAFVTLLIIIFITGGYLTAWLVKQRILFYQNTFWLTFWLLIIALACTIFFFIWFLIKQDSNFGFYDNEFFDKATLGWTSLICLIVTIILFFMMISAYQKGFSDEAMKNLAEAEGKLAEFNYIKDALTGAEVERLLTENFDLVMKDICKDQNRDCQKIISNYRDVKEILEFKERADEIMSALKLIDNKKLSN
ncbi:MAG: hypothetical protein PHF67_03775 [Candidatus Nanoarchaeia archaeon]|nr:hypothetical protein [Candidatus Nanoarchaeia archaeon]